MTSHCASSSTEQEKKVSKREEMGFKTRAKGTEKKKKDKKT